jgi:hypothetical protein
MLDPAVDEQVAPALLATGYVEEARTGVTALVRGEEEYGINIRDRVPDDPLGGPLGSGLPPEKWSSLK